MCERESVAEDVKKLSESSKKFYQFKSYGINEGNQFVICQVILHKKCPLKRVLFAANIIKAILFHPNWYLCPIIVIAFHIIMEVFPNEGVFLFYEANIVILFTDSK